MTYEPGDWATAIADSGFSPYDLWLAFVSVGGDLSRSELGQVVSGTRPPSAREHNELAQTLNERLHDMGKDWPVPYRE